MACTAPEFVFSHSTTRPVMGRAIRISAERPRDRRPAKPVRRNAVLGDPHVRKPTATHIQ